MAMGGASPTPTGSTALTVFGGLAGGVFIEGSVGGGARVQHRLAPSLALGVDGLAGAAIAKPGDVTPRSLFAGRAHLQLNPAASENLAVTFGVGGGGTNNSLGYVTADVSARVSGRFANRAIEPYVAGLAALSVPVETPPGAVMEGGNDRRFLTTAYAGLNAGLMVHTSTRSALYLDLPIFLGFSAANNAILFAPNVGFRYAFGGVTGR